MFMCIKSQQTASSSVWNTQTHTHKHTHTHTNTHTQLFNRTTQVSQYQKKHSPTHTHKEEGFAQTTRSIAWELIPFAVLWASEGCETCVELKQKNIEKTRNKKTGAIILSEYQAV